MCCWLGLLTSKTVSRIFCTVLVETLNPALSYPYVWHVRVCLSWLRLICALKLCLLFIISIDIDYLFTVFWWLNISVAIDVLQHQSKFICFCDFYQGPVLRSTAVLPLQHVQPLLFRWWRFAKCLSAVLEAVFKPGCWRCSSRDRSAIRWSCCCDCVCLAVHYWRLQDHAARLYAISRPVYHRLNGSSSPVLTATCLSYGSLCDFLTSFSPTDLEVTPLDRFWRKMAQTTWIHEHVCLLG